MNRARNARGNMLFLVVLTIGLIVSTGMMGFGFSRFLAHRTRAQSQIDAESLSYASSINQGNRVGQINELEQCSRELVYLSRKRYDKCHEDEDSSFLGPLCYQLLTEAREGHNLLEAERQNQIQQISREIQQAIQNYNTQANASPPFQLCWPAAGQPHIDGACLGSLSKGCSNVRNLDVIKELSEYDRNMGYVDPRSNLFKAEINAKLPNEGDLDFYFSGLSANVEGSCSPARNANPDIFVSDSMIVQNGQAAKTSTKHLPNAVQLFSSINASAGDGANGQVNLVSTGVTSGDTSKPR